MCLGRQCGRAATIVLLTLLLGCDRDQPLAPGLVLAFRVTEAPSVTTAVAAPAGRIDVRWQDNSSNETGFEVYRSISGVGGPYGSHSSTQAGVTTFSDVAITPGREYCYEVRAYRTTGRRTTYSEFSNAACAIAPPSVLVPSNAEAKPVSSSVIDVSWRDNADGETGFKVERSLDLGSTWTPSVTMYGPNRTSATVFGQTSDQQVCWRVIAFNSYGDSDPSNVDCTAPPAAPANLAATSIDAHSSDLAWEDRSLVEDGYEVQRSLGTGDWIVVVTLPANTSGYHDAGLASDTRYWYQVRALKDGGGSDFSNIDDAVTVGSPPPAPASAAAYPNGSTAVSVGWESDAPTVEGFRVERSSNGGADWATVATTPSYERGVLDWGLAAEQPVCYRVFAFNLLGDSPPSNSDCTTPPAAPDNLVATGLDASSILLTWTNHSAVADGYEVQEPYCYWDYYYGYTCWYYGIATLGPTATSYTVSGLAPLTSYWYRVVALKEGGYSDPSNEAGATTHAAP